MRVVDIRKRILESLYPRDLEDAYMVMHYNIAEDDRIILSDIIISMDLVGSGGRYDEMTLRNKYRLPKNQYTIRLDRAEFTVGLHQSWNDGLGPVVFLINVSFDGGVEVSESLVSWIINMISKILDIHGIGYVVGEDDW